jgi:hypothetical protein
MSACLYVFSLTHNWHVDRHLSSDFSEYICVFFKDFPQLLGNVCLMNIPYVFIYHPEDMHVLHSHRHARTRE